MLVVEFLLDTSYEFAHHFGFALHDLGIIKTYTLCLDAILVGMRGVVVLFCAIEQRLGWDTSHIETSTAQCSLLKDNDVFTCFRSYFSGSIACWTTANDCKEVFHCVVQNLFNIVQRSSMLLPRVLYICPLCMISN